MLLGTRVLPLVSLLAVPAFLPSVPGQQLGRPQTNGKRGVVVIDGRMASR